VTDISACRLREQLQDSLGNSVRTPEPLEPCQVDGADGGKVINLDGGMGQCPISLRSCRRATDCVGFLPGTYASMFVFNFNFPDALDEGDLLFTLSGSVQEFTSTTQMVFPAWTTAERVRRLKVGHPLDPATEVGPLVHERHLEKVLSYAAIARGEGASVAVGGARATGVGLPPARLKGLAMSVKPTSGT
jgi:hypothetical protein